MPEGYHSSAGSCVILPILWLRIVCKLPAKRLEYGYSALGGFLAHLRTGNGASVGRLPPYPQVMVTLPFMLFLSLKELDPQARTLLGLIVPQGLR